MTPNTHSHSKREDWKHIKEKDCQKEDQNPSGQTVHPEAPNQASWTHDGFFCSPEGLAGLVMYNTHNLSFTQASFHIWLFP